MSIETITERLEKISDVYDDNYLMFSRDFNIHTRTDIPALLELAKAVQAYVNDDTGADNGYYGDLEAAYRRLEALP